MGFDSEETNNDFSNMTRIEGHRCSSNCQHKATSHGDIGLLQRSQSARRCSIGPTQQAKELDLDPLNRVFHPAMGRVGGGGGGEEIQPDENKIYATPVVDSNAK